MLFSLWLCFAFVLNDNVLLAQMLQLNIINNTDGKLLLTKKFSSELELKSAAEKFLWSYYYSGYLLADFDSISVYQSTYSYYFNKNDIFVLANLRRGNLESRLYYSYFESKKFEKRGFNYSELINLFDKIVKHYENNGYPFASIKLDSIQIDGNFISASLLVDKNQKILVDSIITQGDLKVNKRFLYRYIDIFPSSVYNEKKLQQIEAKLKKLPFAYIRQSPIVRISDKNAKVYIFANKRNASQFDGIIGVQPDATGNSIITGNLKIKLVNAIFKNADILDLDWQRVQVLTQNFKFGFSIPYLVGTSLGSQYQITLFKKDTSFIDVQNTIGIDYYFSGINSIRFFYKQRNSNLISTHGLSGVTTLPDYADIITKQYGAGLSFNNLNNINNPSSGWNIALYISVGNKNIIKNPGINDLAYQNILLHSIQYQSEGIIERYFSNVFTKYGSIKTAVKYGYINGNTTLFKNELFRIGGLKSMRGFNEQSIYVSTYVIPTLEYRFIYSENGYVMIFSDIAYCTSNYSNQKQQNRIYSIGAGIQFDTKAGLFNLIYALGSNFGQMPDFRAGKIHAGLITLF